MNNNPPVEVDYLEAGSAGPAVILVHSSVAGARQWRHLMEDGFRVRAINLFGYGKTPAWPDGARQSLDGHARLVGAVLAPDAEEVHLVGHSFGGGAPEETRYHAGAPRPNPVYLLAQSGHTDAFAEAMALRDCVKKFGALGEWRIAAKRSADYWGGVGTWEATPPDRRETFAQALKPNFFEWDAVTDESTRVEEWARMLPRATLVVADPNTVRPIRGVVPLLRQSCPAWVFAEVTGGHMAPLIHPCVIDPIVASFCDRPSRRLEE